MTDTPSPDIDAVALALDAALERTQYQPGDYPVVPMRLAAFVDEIRTIRASLSALPKAAKAEGVTEWDGHPTPSEAARDLRDFARKRGSAPGDNIFEDAARIIDALSQPGAPKL